VSSVIARRYAKALIELGVETGQLEAIVREISAVAETVEPSLELRDVRDNPQIPAAARKAVFVEVAQKVGAGQLTRNAISLLADNGRLRYLGAIAKALREEADRRAGVVRAVVSSAAPLSDVYVQKLTQALEARYQKKVVVQREVDPKLLAGVVTRIGDTIIDGSLSARLRELKTELLPH
jgi:F-type H+-transporting ATPase subunit delta